MQTVLTKQQSGSNFLCINRRQRQCGFYSLRERDVGDSSLHYELSFDPHVQSFLSKVQIEEASAICLQRLERTHLNVFTLENVVSNL